MMKPIPEDRVIQSGEQAVAAEAIPLPEDTSHRQIIRSTGIIGMSQVIVTISGIIRTKIVAIVLGPAGVGLIGLFQTAITLIQGTTGLGLGFSSVRDIAEASESKDPSHVSKTILVLKRWAVLTGLLGTAFTLIFCKFLSRITFGDDSYTWSFVALSLILLVASLSTAQISILQGLRKIPMMAKATVAGNLLGLAISIPLYLLLRVQGIVPAMVVSAGASLVISWLYTRRIALVRLSISFRETLGAGKRMLKLGSLMVLASLAATGTMYILRIFITKKLDVAAVGLFQASWNLSTVYLSGILGAMSADYFPRISAINSDHRQLKQLANEQTEVAILAAGPLILTLLPFSAWVIRFFYSSRFDPAIPLLQWQILGSFFRLLSWPMAYIILAKGKGLLYVVCECVFYVSYLVFVYAGWEYYSLKITGIAFLISYICYFFFVWASARRIAQFSFSRVNVTHTVFFLSLILLVFLGLERAEQPWRVVLELAVIGGACAYSLLRLRKHINFSSLYHRIPWLSGRNRKRGS